MLTKFSKLDFEPILKKNYQQNNNQFCSTTTKFNTKKNNPISCGTVPGNLYIYIVSKKWQGKKYGGGYANIFQATQKPQENCYRVFQCGEGGAHPEAGCSKCKKCHACKILEEGKSFKSTNTRKKYPIR